MVFLDHSWKQEGSPKNTLSFRFFGLAITPQKEGQGQGGFCRESFGGNRLEPVSVQLRAPRGGVLEATTAFSCDKGLWLEPGQEKLILHLLKNMFDFPLLVLT